MNTRLDTIRKKAVELGHSFGLPLSLAEILEFEERYRVELPEEFRQFLQLVGNGGDGPPVSGLMKLGEVPDCLSSECERDWKELAHVAKPFPFTNAWGWEGEEYDQVRRESARYGSVNLGHDGCGLYWLLIVTGSERGQVWAYTDVGVCPQEPRRDFVAWVEAWLDGVWWWTS